MFKQTLMVYFLLAWSIQAQAEVTISFPLKVTPGPVISKTEQKDAWVLPLSKYQKVDGFWRNDKSITLSGKLVSQTYLLRSSDGYQQLLTYYETWAGQKGFDILFMCKGRSCGSSNDWANRFFKDRRLNGLQGKQLFIALRKENVYMALYLVERPTGQIYLRFDQLLNDAGKSNAINTPVGDEAAPHG